MIYIKLDYKKIKNNRLLKIISSYKNKNRHNLRENLTKNKQVKIIKGKYKNQITSIKKLLKNDRLRLNFNIKKSGNKERNLIVHRSNIRIW